MIQSFPLTKVVFICSRETCSIDTDFHWQKPYLDQYQYYQDQNFLVSFCFLKLILQDWWYYSFWLNFNFQLTIVDPGWFNLFLLPKLFSFALEKLALLTQTFIDINPTWISINATSIKTFYFFFCFLKLVLHLFSLWTLQKIFCCPLRTSDDKIIESQDWC